MLASLRSSETDSVQRCNTSGNFVLRLRLFWETGRGTRTIRPDHLPRAGRKSSRIALAYTGTATDSGRIPARSQRRELDRNASKELLDRSERRDDRPRRNA